MGSTFNVIARLSRAEAILYFLSNKLTSIKMRSNNLKKCVRSWTKKSAIASLAFLLFLSNISPLLILTASASNETLEAVSQNATSENAGQDSSSSESLSGNESTNSLDDTNIIDLASPSNSSNDKEKDNNSDKTKNTPNNDKGGLTEVTSASTTDPDVNPLNQTYDSKKNMPKTNVGSGALVYDYPIQVSSGRNGLEPDLKLNYNSQNASNDNLIGYGWSINIPYIERINRKGTDKFYTENYFNSSLSGELVLISGTQYGSKVENGEFLKYEFSNNSWTVTDKSGTKYKFGINAAARQDNPNDTTKVAKWMLEETRDLNDNYARYEYFKDQGQIYPSRIIYTGNGTTDGIFTVEFSRQTRTDAYTSYKTAFQVKTNYRINEIQTTINGTWTRKYTLAYATGDNSVRAMLSSITESGRDESGNIVTLPLTTFNYQNPTAGWTKDASRDLPSYTYSGHTYRTMFANGQGKDPYGVRLVDVNGDGLTDIIRSSESESTTAIYINNGSGWTQDASWVIPTDTIDGTPNSTMYFNTSNGADRGVRFADVNGDGLTDIVRSHLGWGSPSYVSDYGIYINNGTGWTKNVSWDLPSYTYSGHTYRTMFANDQGADPYGVRLMDVNGDGFVDVLRSSELESATAVYLNNGTGWTQSSWTIPTDTIDGTPNRTMYFTTPSGTDMGVRFEDVNGDGLTDIVRSRLGWGSPSMVSDYGIYINNGNGWTKDTSWDLPSYSYSSHTYRTMFANDQGKDPYGVRLLDVNGDGFVDIIRSSEMENATTVYVNNGSGWTQDASWVIPTDTIDGSPNSTMYFNTSFGTDMGVRFADVDGDGMTEIVRSKLSWTGNSDFGIYINNGIKSDSLNNIVYPRGGSTSITYKSSSQYVNGSTLLNPNLPFNLETVLQITNNDGLGNSFSKIYSYEGGKYYFDSANPFDRKFSGFAKVVEIDSVGSKISTFYHQGDATNFAQGEYLDNYSKIGRSYRSEVSDSSGNLYSKSINKWESYDLGGGRSFVKLTQAVDSSFDGNASHKDKAETYTYDNANGNVTAKIQWGEVTGADDGTFTDIGTDKLSTSISYASNTTLNILGLPSQEITNDQSANKINESKYYYDTLTLGSVNKGNLTKEEKWVSGTNYINNQKAYNSYGLVTSETDARNNTTNYSYDSYNLYPTTVTNPLNQVTQYIYDYSLGKPKQTTDPNGYIFQNVYDGLDRVKEEKQPDLTTPSTLVTKSAYVYTDTGNPTSVKKTDYLDATNGVDSYTYFDGLGRAIQTRKVAENANTYSVSDVVYNNRGLVQKKSLPYFGSGYSKTSATTDNSLYSTNSYDPLERVISTTNAVGTITNSYDDWKVTTTDAKGTPKDLYNDAYGNLIRVDEHDGANVYTTTYNYDGLGNLLKITDALGNIRNFTYDALGRRLSAEDLHALSDATFGVYNYTYDANGNLTSKTDPKSQTVNYVYDALNRATSEDYTGQTGTEVTYTYDTCTGGVGKLCSVANASGSETKQYNALGLISSETKTIDSVNYTTSHTYDRQGNETLLTNPDNSQVKYEYNSAGLLEKISSKESAGSNLPSSTNLVGFWNFNESSGAIASDSSGSGHNGALENMESSDWVSGISGNGLNLDGTNERVDMGIMENVPVGQGLTVSVWIKPNELTSGGHVISRYSPSGIQYSMWKGENDVAFFINGGSGGNYVVAWDVLSTDSWTHLVGVFNDATKEHKLYANGVLKDSRTYNVTLNNPAVKTLVGTSNYYQDYFNGKIDEARVYNKVLTDAEIMALYQNPSGSASSNFTDLVTNYDYSPLGKVTTQAYANGTSTTNSYDTTKLYRLTSKVTVIPGGSHSQDLAYTYDANGNITRIVDNSATNSKKTTDYTYDSLNRLLSATATGAGSGQNNTGLAGKWNFNEGAGTVANDSSGNNNNGTINGADWISGVNGSGLNFDGIYDHSSVSDSPIWDTGSALSVSVWIKPNGVADGDAIVVHDLSNYKWLLYLSGTNSAKASLYVRTASGVSATPYTANLNDGQWHHVAATYDKALASNRLKIYVDGALSAQDNGFNENILDGDEGLSIGSKYYATDGGYSGGMDGLKVYNRALTEQEIIDLYNSAEEEVGGNYTETYTYDAIGNITNKSDKGNYTYSQTGKANPNAATSIGSTNYTYDDNGNLISEGALTNTWDYNNRMTQSVVGSMTINYGYDAGGQRIKYSNGSSTSIYPSKFYNTDGTTPTKHVFAGGQLVATIKGTGANATVYAVSTDHLTGSNVVTNSTGVIEELMDYYPYGDIRLDEKAGSFNEQRKFAGHEYDTDTGLSYMNARYYNGKIGRFISQDPAFWDFSHVQTQLVDPQSWNSYAYARNNPLANVDTDGQFWDTILDVATTTYDSVRYGERMMTAAAGAVNIGIGTAMNNQRIIAAGDVQLAQGVQGMNALKSDIAMDAAGTAIPGVPIAGLKAVKNADIVVGVAQKVEKWKIGDDITKATKNGYPSWSTVRQRFWKNEALNSTEEYSVDNVARMQKGLAPKTKAGESYELHHINGRNIPDPHNQNNLQRVTPQEHSFIDPFRYIGKGGGRL